MSRVKKLSFVLIVLVFFGSILTASADTSPNTPCANLTATLYYGEHDSDTNGQVTLLQNFLYTKGYLNVTATGYFGPLTKNAVESFQKTAAVGAVDGIVGVQTRAHIFAASCTVDTPVLPIGAPSISAITPVQGSVGTTVTLSGNNFASNDIVHFASGAISAFSVGSNGSTITFTIPSAIGPYCKPDVACPDYAMLITNGTYQISVENSDGISNTVSYIVVGNPGAVL